MSDTKHKPYLTYDEQCGRIAEYGIVVDNREICIHDLRRLGYYRLSAYWYPFRITTPESPTPQSRVHPGITFAHIVAVCEFDEALRHILLEAISTIEIGVRVAIAYQLGEYEAMGYLTPQAWGDHCHVRPEATGEDSSSATPFETFCAKHAETLKRAEEDFVVHFRDKYNGEIPVWAAIELWDFGTMSRAFRMLKPRDKQAMASQFGVSSKVFTSWLVAINDLRNFCAHHNRLSRRVFVNKPKIPRTPDLPEFAHNRVPQDGDKVRLYPLLCVMSYLVANLAAEQPWRSRVVNHFRQVDRLHGLHLDNYGIPTGWSTEALWRTK